MTDARLGISVDSDSAIKGAIDLDRLEAAAVAAGYAIDRLADHSVEGARAQTTLSSASQVAASTVANEVAAIERAFAAQNAFTASTRAQAAATREATAAMHNMRFGVANVAAQFQDIAVTSAMGMSPWTIALQQGTQLSAAFGGQGLTGVFRMLGTAVASVLSPVSLLTIGMVALSAMAIQSLGSIWKEEETVQESLKKHREWLDEILVGYDDVATAAEKAAESAMKLPQAVLESNLEDEIEKIVDNIGEKLGSLRTMFQDDLDFMKQMQDVDIGSGGTGEIWAEAIDAVEAMRDLGITTQSTKGEIEAAAASVREFMNSTDDPALKEMASSVLALLERLAALRGEAYSTAAALATLQNQALQTSMENVTDSTVKAIENIRRLAPELRSSKEQARDLLNEALGDAPDALLRKTAVDEYNKTISAIDENEARLEANRKTRSAASSGAKSENRWERELLDYEKRLEAIRTETRMVGQSERAIEKAREEHRLLSEAKAAGIPITEELTHQVSAMADAYGQVSEELERAKERQEEWDDRIEFARETTGNFLIDTKNNLKETGDLWGSMADAAENALDRTMDRMLNAVNDQVWELLAGQLMNIFGGGLGLGGGGATGGAWGKGLWGSAIFNAKGNVFGQGSLSGMSNTVQDQPTLFAFAKGGTNLGVLGEDPGSPGEAIMPLTRGPDGTLGVKASGGGGDVPAIHMYFYGGSEENRAEASRRDDGGIDVRAWLVSEVTQEASKRGTTLNSLIRSGGGNQLTGR